MKKLIAVIMCCACMLSLCACGVKQEDYDALQADMGQVMAELEATAAQLKTAKQDIDKLKSRLDSANTELESTKTQLENTKTELESTKTQLESTKTQLEDVQGKYDELKNGPEAQLAAIRTAYDKQDWAQVVKLAKTLHSKYAGYDEDVEAQQLAANAQKTIDDEKAKAEAEAKKTKEEKVHNIIRITRLECSRPNSAGGVGIYLEFINMHPEKTIKYLEVTVVPKNAVGDTQYCDIRDYARYTCEATGPYAPGDGLRPDDNWWWGNAWYNSTIKYIELTGVWVEYMDGTYTSLTSDELEFAIW